MSRTAIPINISKRVSSILLQTMGRRQLGGHYRKRMTIVYQSSLGEQNKNISKELKCSVVTVRKWRLKWKLEEENLMKFEDNGELSGVSDLELLRKIKEVLSDAPRSGSSCAISDSDKIRLQALACQSPKEFNLPFSVWTHLELSNQMARMGIKICSSYCGIILKKRITTS